MKFFNFHVISREAQLAVIAEFYIFMFHHDLKKIIDIFCKFPDDL